ncbi:MAG: hypothetical protein L6Q92_00135 [Phycisphaerae bacterium]|nr:hypothetical protein [Phycisphaerae bacterium]
MRPRLHRWLCHASLCITTMLLLSGCHEEDFSSGDIIAIIVAATDAVLAILSLVL